MNQIKEQITEHGLATRRTINKPFLKNMVKVFKNNGKKSFFDTMTVDGYSLNQNLPGHYTVKDAFNSTIITFNAEGLVLTTDKAREQAFIDFVEVYINKEQLEKKLVDNSNLQSVSKKLKI